MRKRGLFATMVIVCMLALIVVYVLVSYNRIKPKENRICDGVMVDTVQVGGMTADEANQAVNEHIAQKRNQGIQIMVSGHQVVTTVGEVGYGYSAGDFTKKALEVGRGGNMLENYREMKQAANGKMVYPVKASFDEKQLKQFVKKQCKSLCTKAKNAEVKMEDGEFVYTKSQEGLSLDVKETMQMIRDAVEKSTDVTQVITLTANVTVQQPKVSVETASRCKDKIGTFSTTFNAGNVNRTKNVSNAARLISGSVVYPGETFSVHDAISPLTEENGYYAAASYNNGKVEDSLGGGVCQVSTTLYNAILRAELEIVERSPHSMVVSYVEPAMDAAIAGDYKDFKFKNNTEVPIYIQGGTYGGTIYFNVYGEETRSSARKVRFESEIIQTIKPGADKVTWDKTKPESYLSVTQSAHTGYKALLWKIVTEDGKETKTQINSSTYSASPRYVVRGSMKEKKDENKKDDTTKKPSGNSQNNQNKTSDSNARRRESSKHAENRQQEGTVNGEQGGAEGSAEAQGTGDSEQSQVGAE